MWLWGCDCRKQVSLTCLRNVKATETLPGKRAVLMGCCFFAVFLCVHLFTNCIHPLQYTCHSLSHSFTSLQFYKAFLKDDNPAQRLASTLLSML